MNGHVQAEDAPDAAAWHQFTSNVIKLLGSLKLPQSSTRIPFYPSKKGKNGLVIAEPV